MSAIKRTRDDAEVAPGEGNEPKPGRAQPAGTFAAAFVLPVTRDGRALLTRDRRGSETKYSLLGGSAHADETDFECMAREANEETGGGLSAVTLARIRDGRGVIGPKVVYDHAKAHLVMHDLVHKPDLDVDGRFDLDKALAMRAPSSTTKRSKPEKTQVGIEFVDMTQLRDWQWRGKEMSHHASVLVARLLK